MNTKNRYSLVLRWALKLKYINQLGGKCIQCGCSDIRCLEFNHKQDKENLISTLIRCNNHKTLDEEIKNCNVMCARCHSIHHCTGDIKDNKRRDNKKILLEFKGIDKCYKCGWIGHQSALDFHHLDDKNFRLSSDINIRLNSIYDITKNIENEINKCVVICKNCHRIEHCSKDYEKIKNDIYNKEIKNYRKADHNEVIKLYKNGISMGKISKQLNITKSLVHYIIHKDD